MKQQKKILRGEAALILAVIINSLGVLLMLPDSVFWISGRKAGKGNEEKKGKIK